MKACRLLPLQIRDLLPSPASLPSLSPPLSSLLVLPLAAAAAAAAEYGRSDTPAVNADPLPVCVRCTAAASCATKCRHRCYPPPPPAPRGTRVRKPRSSAYRPAPSSRAVSCPRSSRTECRHILDPRESRGGGGDGDVSYVEKPTHRTGVLGGRSQSRCSPKRGLSQGTNDQVCTMVRRGGGCTVEAT